MSLPQKMTTLPSRGQTRGCFTGNLFVFDLRIDEAKTISWREGRINNILSSFNLKLEQNEASTQEGQTPMEVAETLGNEASTSGNGSA